MALSSGVDIERLEKQLYANYPYLQRCNEECKQSIRYKLKRQLQCERPEVQLERCHVLHLLENIERNFQKCKDFGIIETSNDAYEAFQRTHQMIPSRPPPLMSEAFTSDDDTEYEALTIGRGEITPQHDVNYSEDMTLVLRKSGRKRQFEMCDTPRSNCSSVSTTASSRRSTRCSYKSVKVSRSDTMEGSTTVKVFVPTILQDDNQKLEISIDLAKIDLARRVLNNKIKRISNGEQTRASANALQKQKAILQKEKQQDLLDFTAPEQDDSFSRFVSEVLVEPNSIETWQATNALENINNNLDDNYNSNIIPVPPTKENTNLKTSKKRVVKVDKSHKLPRKRGRKLGSKNLPKVPQPNISQEGEKSDLAKYVELFSNDCDIASNAPTSSTISHEIVTSSTQNCKEPEQISDGTQTAQITYLLNGEWANGGTCQFVSSANIGNIISLDTSHMTQDDFNLNTPFEDFVNYIDSSNNDIGNNVIARVLEGNNATSNSNMIDASNIMSLGAGSILDQIRKPPIRKIVNSITTHQAIDRQKAIKFSDCSNSSFIEKSQNITMSHTIKSLPPPAHCEIADIALDLSRTSESFSEQETSIDNCAPIDLSMKSQNKTNELQGNNVAGIQRHINSQSNDDDVQYNSVADNQPNMDIEESDDNFIRRLIESSEFNSTNTIEHGDLQDDVLEINESFRAALDMPLLDNEKTIADNTDTYSNRLIEHSLNKTEISQYQDVNNLSSPTHKSYYKSDNSSNENKTSQQQDIQNLVSPTDVAYNQQSENKADILADFRKHLSLGTQPDIETNSVLNIFLYSDKNNNKDNFDTDSSASAATELVIPLVATEKSINLRDFGTNVNGENSSLDVEIENPSLMVKSLQISVNDEEVENPSLKAKSSEISVNDKETICPSNNMSNQANDNKLILLSDKDDLVQILDESKVIVDTKNLLNNIITANDPALSDEILPEQENYCKGNEQNINYTNNMQVATLIVNREEIEPKVAETSVSSLLITKQEYDLNKGAVSQVEIEKKAIIKKLGIEESDTQNTQQKWDLYQNLEKQIQCVENVEAREPDTTEIKLPNTKYENEILKSAFNQNLVQDIPNEVDVKFQLPYTTVSSLLNTTTEWHSKQNLADEVQLIEHLEQEKIDSSLFNADAYISNEIVREKVQNNDDIPQTFQNTENLENIEKINLIPKIIIKATMKSDDGTAKYFIKKQKLCDVEYQAKTIRKENALPDQHSKEQIYIEKITNDNAEVECQKDISEIKENADHYFEIALNNKDNNLVVLSNIFQQSIESIDVMSNDNFEKQNSLSSQEVQSSDTGNAGVDVIACSTTEFVSINTCEIPDIQSIAEKENFTTEYFSGSLIKRRLRSENKCEISNVQLQEENGNGTTADLPKGVIEKPVTVTNEDTKISIDEILNKSNKKENYIFNSSSNNSNTHDLVENISNKGFEGVICNSTSKGDKAQKLAPKVHIISVIQLDSFDSANEDDDEFIRRTLYSKKMDNADLHGKTRNELIKMDADATNSEESNDNKNINIVVKAKPDNDNTDFNATDADELNDNKNINVDINVKPDNDNTDIFNATDSDESNHNKNINADINAKPDIEPKTDIDLDHETLEPSIKGFKRLGTIDLTISTIGDEIILKDEDERDSLKAIDFSFKTTILEKNFEDNTITYFEDHNIEHSDRSNNGITYNLKNKSGETLFEKCIEKCEFMKRLNLIGQGANKLLEDSEDRISELENAEDSKTQYLSSVTNTNYEKESNDSNNSVQNEKKLNEEFEDSKNSNSSLILIEESTSSLVSIKQEVPEKHTVEKKESSTSSSLFLSNLSVLEMERQFDEPYLDFESQLDDDALSLSTSCFNSPDDDRFTNLQICDNPDKTIATIYTESKHNADEKTVNRSPIKVAVSDSAKAKSKEFSNVLKKFKIPKLFENSAEHISKSILPAVQVDLSQPPPPLLPIAIRPTDLSATKRIGLEKLTRTVQNVCAVPPLPLQPPPLFPVSNLNIYAGQRKHDLLTMPSTSVNPINFAFEVMRGHQIGDEFFTREILNPPAAPDLNSNSFVNMSRGQFADRGGEALNSGIGVLDIAKIFGATCLPFLVNNCTILDSPQHTHQLRDPGVVKIALEALSKTELNLAYRFMFNHTKLFSCYFYIFCSVYASQNNRSKLMNMVYDCEKHTGYIGFLRVIFYSLIDCGLNKANACRQILSRSRDMAPTTIDVLVSIIFETDWGMFYDYLERYAQTPQYSFRINVLNEMAPRVLRTKDTRLSAVLCKCLLALNPDDLPLIQRSPDLMQLLELMKDGKVC